MKKNIIILATAAFAAFTIGCAENPADGVAEAKVEAPPSEETKGSSEKAPEAPAGEVKKYAFTEASKISFVGSKVTGSHEGGFEKFTGYFSVAGDQLSGSDHKVVIDMNSTWSDSEKLTGHLKAPDFFDVEKFPESTFTLNKVTKSEGNQYELTGELTLHGVTKAISFPAEITGDAGGFNLKAEFFVKRFDFEIVYPGKANDLIRDEVVIKLDLKADPA